MWPSSGMQLIGITTSNCSWMTSQFGDFLGGLTMGITQFQVNPNEYVDTAEDKEMEVEFLSSVKWKKTDIPFEKRME
ncbi:hypothetical protein DsansV1_C06g0067181 [Dioscorea sansibarensis]